MVPTLQETHVPQTTSENQEKEASSQDIPHEKSQGTLQEPESQVHLGKESDTFPEDREVPKMENKTPSASEDLQVVPSREDRDVTAGPVPRPVQRVTHVQKRYYSSTAQRSKSAESQPPCLLWSNVKFSDAINHDPLLASLKVTLKRYVPDTQKGTKGSTQNPKLELRFNEIAT